MYILNDRKCAEILVLQSSKHLLLVRASFFTFLSVLKITYSYYTKLKLEKKCFTDENSYMSKCGSSRPEVFCKKVFLEISQNSQGTTCATVSVLIKL